MTGAVLFDLDDTLYRERRFMLSGFAAVAEAVAERTEMSAREAFRVMWAAARRGERSRAFQLVSAASGLDESAIGDLVACYREHAPRLRLPRITRDALYDLREYQLAIVTNGLPSVQARKVAALGLDALISTVIYAEACGTGLGKPDPQVFREALRRLGVPATRAVFVGDHPCCDIAGARAAGLATVQIVPTSRALGVAQADIVLPTMRWVPPSVRGLLHARAA